MANGYRSYIAEGFADDCDELIHRCVKSDTPVNFRIFSKNFTDMQLTSIFHDRASGAEIAELSEEVINVAKHYMVANTGNFEESVVGLFLVYALVILQPFKEFAYMRLVQDDVPYIERIEQVARRDKRFDVLYVLGKLLIEHTRYTAVLRERGMEPSYRKYIESCSSVVNLGLRPKGVFLRQNEELDIIRELNSLQVQYDAAKAAANAEELKYMDPKLPMDLDSSLKNIIAGFIHEDDAIVGDVEEEEGPIKSIKEKAMKSKVKPIKHRMGVQERTAASPGTAHKSDIKTVPGKVKTGSPIKQVATNKAVPRRQKRKREHDSDETSEESETSFQLSEHESDCDDINLENFDKAIPTTETSNSDTEFKDSISKIEFETCDTKAKDANEVEIDSRKIRLGALPCVITTEDNGKTYQIEIIDKLNQSTNPPDRTSRREFTKSSVEDEIRKPPKEKRDLKKTILMSRFKRMGIEPIANFKDT